MLQSNQKKKKKDIIIIFIYGDINFEQKAIIQIIKIYTTVDSWSLHKYKCYLWGVGFKSPKGRSTHIYT